MLGMPINEVVFMNENTREENRRQWAKEHAIYVKKNFPGRIADPKHPGHMIVENPEPENYCSPCCGGLISYSTSGCYSCCICHECGGRIGCLNNNPGLCEDLDNIRTGKTKPNSQWGRWNTDLSSLIEEKLVTLRDGIDPELIKWL